MHTPRVRVTYKCLAISSPKRSTRQYGVYMYIKKSLSVEKSSNSKYKNKKKNSILHIDQELILIICIDSNFIISFLTNCQVLTVKSARYKCVIEKRKKEIQFRYDFKCVKMMASLPSVDVIK